jgi:hypothetical protein
LRGTIAFDQDLPPIPGSGSLWLSLAVAPPAWKAGGAKISITPRRSLWMAVLGDRRKPAEGIDLEVYAWALALEDSSGKRAVLVSTDIVGVSGCVSKVVSERVREQCGIALPAAVELLTHCGPVVGHMLQSGR